MDRSIIREGAERGDSIIGRHVTINSCFKKPTRIWELSVIADDVIVEEGSFLKATKVYPHLRVGGTFEKQTIVSS